jgi:hypothetical protein
MAAADKTKQLSTPAIYLDGELVEILPNSAKVILGTGESTVRAVSGGGNAVSAVVSVDASKMISKVSFDLAVTAANIQRAQKHRERALNGDPITIRVVNGSHSLAFASMYSIKDLDLQLSNDGKLPQEFDGVYAG